MSQGNFWSRNLFHIVLLGAILTVSVTLIAVFSCTSNECKTGRFLEEIKDRPTLLRMFMQNIPKGGDLHIHLGGAVYAETYLDWAAADGLCFDLSVPAIIKLKSKEVCVGPSRMLVSETILKRATTEGWCIDLSIPREIKLRPPEVCAEASRMPASEAMKVPDDEIRRRLINGLSMRSFVPTPGWSGHDQFFATFDRMKEKDHRFEDMLVEVAQRASRQNLMYLELMETGNVGKMMGYVESVMTQFNEQKKKEDDNYEPVNWLEWASWSPQTLQDNLKVLHQALKAGAGGKTLADQMPLYVSNLRNADQNRFTKLACVPDSSSPSGYRNPEKSPPGELDKPAGCEVVIRFLYQNIRKFSPEVVFTQFMFSFELMRRGVGASPVVGMNLVAPEDWLVATRDYRLHMEMLDFLWRKELDKKKLNIALHAGELTLGNVRPDELKYRIRLAIERGHARRIGHGVAIAYEDNSLDLLARMASEDILIEINLTSNAKILNVSGRDHPMRLYHTMGVPIALSSDDDAVLRSDLTRDYVLAVIDQGFGYADLKAFSQNSLDYSFLDMDTKKRLDRELDKGFTAFEAWVKKDMADKICGSNWLRLPTMASC
jgi:adenosine deaminase